MSEPQRNPFIRFLSQHSYNINKPDKSPESKINPLQEGQHVEETYRMLERAVEQSADGIAMADMEGKIKFCNQAWAKMHGYEIYEILGKNLSIFHTGEQLEREVLPFHEIVQKNGAHSGEVGHIRKDGTVFLTRMTTTLLKDENGKPLGFVGIGRDITERKRIKKALIDSEEKYRKLFENSIEGIGIFKENNFISANKTLLEIFGYKELEEFIGIPLSYHVALECRGVFREKLREWTRSEFHESRFEYKIIRSDGQIRDVEISVTQILIKDDSYTQGTFRDITEHKLAQAELEKSREKYRTLTENINVGLYRNTSGAKGKFIEANQAMVKMFGYEDKEEFLAIRVCGLYQYPQDRRKLSKKLSDYGFIKNEELPLKRRDGGEFIGSVSAVAVKGEDGKIKYFDGIIEDVTERKRLEQVLQSSEIQYRTTIESMADAIHVVDKDLRFTLFNAAFKKWNAELGMDIEPIGKTISEVFPFLPDSVEKEYEKVFESAEVLITEEHSKIGSKEFDTETRKIPILHGDEVAQILTVVRDITERKRAEELILSKERFMSSVFSSIQDGISVLDKELNIVRVNPKMEQWYAHNMPLLGKKCYEAYHCRKEPCKICPTSQALQTGKSAYEVVPKTSLGGEVIGWIGLYAFPLLDVQTGQMQGVIEYVRDITENKKAEQHQKATTVGLRAVVEVADQLITCPDLDSLFLRAVELGREKLGLERCAIFLEEEGHVRGFYGTDRYGRTTDEHALCFEKNEYWAKYLQKLKPEDPKWIKVEEPRLEWDGEKTLEIDRGWIVLTPIQSAHRAIGVFVNDCAISKSEIDEVKQETLAVFCSLLGNIAERKRAERKLAVANRELFKSNKRFKQMAFRDSHTGLYNHRYLQEVIEPEFSRAKRYNFPLSVIMLDLDYFKSINDAYSHHFGDLVLKQFARRLKRMVRKYDIIIRFGGEEFLIISPGIDKVMALSLSQRILSTINAASFGNEKFNVRLKLTAAVASFPENIVAKGAELIGLVDKILNKAKEDGGNRVYSSSDVKFPSYTLFEENDESTDVEFLRSKITKLNRRANQSLIESVFAFARTIKLKDQYTGEHVENTVYFATEIAHKLGLSKDEIEQVKRASMLHDLGKIGISERILLKRSKLSPKEFEHIKKHPQIGADILRPIQSLQGIIPLVMSHHERWDGMGYPRGLSKEEIPLGARIVAIADVYQALISDRPYRKAFPEEKAREIVREGSGTQFDPEIVDLFLEIIEK